MKHPISPPSAFSPAPAPSQDCNLLDVLIALQTSPVVHATTAADYAGALRRLPAILGVNSLEDVPADLAFLERRFPRDGFNPAFFFSEPAYRAWRRKIFAAVKRHTGVFGRVAELRARDDDWARLQRLAHAVSGCGTGRSPQRLIALTTLISEARRAGVAPREVCADWVASLTASLPLRQAAALRLAVALLDELRGLLPELDALLPPLTLGSFDAARRKAQHVPQALAAEIDRAVDEIYGGEIDEISGERVGVRAKGTQNRLRAALRRYAATAIAIGAAPAEISDPVALFEREIFNATLRAWIEEDAPTRKLSERSIWAYTKALALYAGRRGLDVPFLQRALALNPVLKTGREADRERNTPARDFCIHLLRNRNAELCFRSAHLHWRRGAEALLERERSGARTPYRRIEQLGMLAAFAALSIYGVPLRINNALDLTLTGREPWLVMPQRPKDPVRIRIPAMHVKNRKRIDAQLCDGPNRALETFLWFVREIRPRMPGAAASPFLFPGEGQTGRISSGCLRVPLQRESRRISLPTMNPHWFRHGMASLYLRHHPGAWAHLATLLGDDEETVRKFYAFLDEEQARIEVQENVARAAGLFRNEDREYSDAQT